MRQVPNVLIALLLVVLACAGFSAARAPRQRSSLVAEVNKSADAIRVGEPVRASILLQESDCVSNLRMLNLLRQTAIRSNIRLAAIWYTGPVTDSASIRQLLPWWTRETPLQPASSALMHNLANLGHRSTPLLVVQDQEGRIRLVSQSPRSAREFAGLKQVITGLTWIEEL